jgi:hypothetical protein
MILRLEGHADPAEVGTLRHFLNIPYPNVLIKRVYIMKPNVRRDMFFFM